MGYLLIGFTVGMFVGLAISVALLEIDSKENDEIPWNKEWDE